MPQQLGDRTAHRIADGDQVLDLQHIGQRGHVVGAVGETERFGGSQTEPVAAVIDSEHMEVVRRAIRKP